MTTMDITVLTYILEQGTIPKAASVMPQEYIQYITDLHETPFEIVTQQDKELVTYLYLVSMVKWLYIEGNDDGAAYYPQIFHLLESVYDGIPEYHTERFNR